MRKLLAVVFVLSLFAYSVAEGGSSSKSDSFGASSFGSKSPSSTTPSSRPNSSFSPSSRPSHVDTTPSTRPSHVDTTPSTRPSSRPDSDAGSTPSTRPSTRPGAGAGANTSPTGPPSGGFHPNADRAATQAKARAESKVTFEASKPPASSYKAPNGKEVRVDPKAPSVEHVRSTMTPEKYQQRTVRIEHHYYEHYGPRYSYYQSQPYIYVGGGYSSLFWYAMLDWDINRRAMWFYQNQSVIDQSLWRPKEYNGYRAMLIQNSLATPILCTTMATLMPSCIQRLPRFNNHKL